MTYLARVLDVLLIATAAARISIPSKISSLSMPLYLTHMLVKWFLVFLLSGIGLYDNVSNAFFFWPFKYCLVLGASLSIALGVKRRLPKIHNYIYGGR